MNKEKGESPKESTISESKKDAPWLIKAVDGIYFGQPWDKVKNAVTLNRIDFDFITGQSGMPNNGLSQFELRSSENFHTKDEFESSLQEFEKIISLKYSEKVSIGEISNPLVFEGDGTIAEKGKYLSIKEYYRKFQNGNIVVKLGYQFRKNKYTEVEDKYSIWLNFYILMPGLPTPEDIIQSSKLEREKQDSLRLNGEAEKL